MMTEQEKRRAQKTYSYAEHEAAKTAYLLLGKERSLEKIATYAGINLSTLKTWSANEGWDEWVKSQEEVQETLALRGLYDAGVLYLNSKARAFLNQIVDKASDLVTDGKLNIKSADAGTAEKLLLIVDGAKTDEKVQAPDWPEEVNAEE
jgi:hypothetical protein